MSGSPIITNAGVQIEYYDNYARITNVGLLVEYSSQSISSVGLMIEYYTIPKSGNTQRKLLLGVG